MFLYRTVRRVGEKMVAGMTMVTEKGGRGRMEAVESEAVEEETMMIERSVGRGGSEVPRVGQRDITKVRIVS